ncbi:hypothetical protein IWX49DRAFT_587274 [Phyllosticta citricarpa]|uniref:Complex III subunit 9 n=1 Tax=Phyllosticta citricarpa TaxID=55181 RepID=A0ABR1MKY8_9PEZI
MRFDRANRFLPIRSRGLGQLPARRHPHPSITPPADQQPTDLLTLGVLRSYRQNGRHRSQHLQASFLRAAGNETTTNDCASTIIKRNYIFVSTVFVGAFGLQLCVPLRRNSFGQVTQEAYTRRNRAFDTASDSLWNNINKGRQWKDIKHQYLEKEDDDE